MWRRPGGYATPPRWVASSSSSSSSSPAALGVGGSRRGGYNSSSSSSRSRTLAAAVVAVVVALVVVVAATPWAVAWTWTWTWTWVGTGSGSGTPRGTDDVVEAHAATVTRPPPQTQPQLGGGVEETTREGGTTPPPHYFAPGSLKWDRTTVLKRCFLPKGFKVSENQGCTVSEKHKLVYHMTPKSGSSTGRHVVKADFEGKDWTHARDCQRATLLRGWLNFATLRNPTTRAFASYEEMFVRNINQQDKGQGHSIPPRFEAFFRPYEANGFTYRNYSAMFDDPQGVARLTRSYEQFMRDWDGTMFDVHLGSQVSYAFVRDPTTGLPSAEHLTRVFDTHNMEAEFVDLAKRLGLPKRPRVIKGRAYPRRLNVSDVSDDAFQRMCEIYAVDYCCLNYELPPACARAPPAKRVWCRWASANDLPVGDPRRPSSSSSSGAAITSTGVVRGGVDLNAVADRDVGANGDAPTRLVEPVVGFP